MHWSGIRSNQRMRLIRAKLVVTPELFLHDQIKTMILESTRSEMSESDFVLKKVSVHTHTGVHHYFCSQSIRWNIRKQFDIGRSSSWWQTAFQLRPSIYPLSILICDCSTFLLLQTTLCLEQGTTYMFVSVSVCVYECVCTVLVCSAG